VSLKKTELGLWILVVSGGLHVLEELALDWRSWAQEISGLPLTWTRFWLLNAAFLVFASACAAIGVRRPAFGMALPCLVFINGVFFHIVPTVVMGRCSPGVFTSVCLYVPFSIWTTWHAGRVGLLTTRVLLPAVALALGTMAMPFVLLALA
jgi:hypothetical protein